MKILRCKWILCLLALMLISSAALAAPGRHERYLVPIHTRHDILLIKESGARLLDRMPSGILIYADATVLDRLEQMGYAPQYVPRSPALPSGLIKETFHNNAGVDTVLAQIAQAYPSITKRVEIGRSVQNRPIYGIVVSKNVNVAEDEPEARVVGAHHGDEWMSVEMVLNFAQYLTSNYGTDTTATNLVDNAEFLLVPLVNPDGREASTENEDDNEGRENANDVDLNRDYGYEYQGEEGGSSHAAFSQPEVRAMADTHFAHNFSISFSYHTTSNYVNYLWNYTTTTYPDEPLISDWSATYASFNNYEHTSGYDWYQTFGDCNDFSYGTRGDFDWTIETPNENITSVWNANRPGLLSTFAHLNDGLRGLVKNASGTPLNAYVLCDTNSWPVYTDPAVGDYHRLMPPNSSDSCTVYSPGYAPARITGFTTPATGNVRQDVVLQPAADSTRYAFQVAAVSTNDSTDANPPNYSPRVLGAPDGKPFSFLVSDASIVLDMLEPMTAGAAHAITVTLTNSAAYTVSVSSDYTGLTVPWTPLGDTYTGTQTISLSSLDVSGARYIKIVGTGSPAVQLDAVAYTESATPTDGDSDSSVDGDSEPASEDGDTSPDGDSEASSVDGDDTNATDGDVSPDGDTNAEAEQATDGDTADTTDRDSADGDSSAITDEPEHHGSSGGCQTNQVPSAWALLLLVGLAFKRRLHTFD